MPRSTLQAGIDLIKSFEGCRLTAYQDSVGVWTIGYGHTAGVRAGMSITQDKAEEYLCSDLKKFEEYVNNSSYVPITQSLTQNQFDALVSFAYNCGSGSLKTLCKDRDASEIAGHLPLYNKAGRNVLAGLTRCRNAELALFNSG